MAFGFLSRDQCFEYNFVWFAFFAFFADKGFLCVLIRVHARTRWSACMEMLFLKCKIASNPVQQMLLTPGDFVVS